MKTKTKELAEEWTQWVEKNNDPYGSAVIKAIENVCAELDEGKSPAEAEEVGIKGSGISGAQAGFMASAIAHFHPRGEEFQKYWNKQMGGTGEENGVIDPSIITVG